MFNPSIQDVRSFFYDTYEKGINHQQLNDMEKIAFTVMLEHPEYHCILDSRAKYFDYEWDANCGVVNPFLHMSLHITIHEQLSINQPVGIQDLYNQIEQKVQDEHETMHEMIDCLGEMIWHAQKNQQQFDVEIYFNCLKSKISKL